MLSPFCIIQFIIIEVDATVRARMDSVAEGGGGFGMGVGTGVGVMGWGPFHPRGFGPVGVIPEGVVWTPHPASRLSSGGFWGLSVPHDASCRGI